MNTITIPAEGLRWALRAAITAAARQDVTPVLCAVHFAIKGGKLSIAATDRYRVHEAVIDIPKDAPEGEFLMHRDQAQWILANFHKPLRSYTDQMIRLEWTGGDATAKISSKSTPAERRRAAGVISVEVLASSAEGAPSFRYELEAVKGNFPPVRRLFPENFDDAERVVEVALSPNLMARLADLTRHRGEPLRFVMPRVADGKAQPVVVQNGDGTARALIQPNIMFTAREWQA